MCSNIKRATLITAVTSGPWNSLHSFVAFCGSEDISRGQNSPSVLEVTPAPAATGSGRATPLCRAVSPDPEASGRDRLGSAAMTSSAGKAVVTVTSGRAKWWAEQTTA